MKIEVCIDSPAGIRLARKYQADRVELCSALSVGGLTPSLGLVDSCYEIGDIDIHAMLRPREGDFVYSREEIEIMAKDMVQMAGLGIKGIVFGCLTDKGKVDTEGNQLLMEKAKELELEVTFHRAFDLVKDPKESLDQLIELGFDRILTSGGKARAIEGIAQIRETVKWSEGRIQIMAGSGVNTSNVRALADAGVDAVHFSSHVAEKVGDLGMGSKHIPNQEKIEAIVKALG